MEYQYNIAGHLCRIVFCDAGNDSSLLPSFSPFESEEEGNLLFCLSVDDAFRWPVTGEEVGQFDCGGNNFGVYRLPDGSYQFEICDEKKALCCYICRLTPIFRIVGPLWWQRAMPGVSSG